MLDLDDPDLTEDLQPPPLLYHYTEPAGFLGIVKSGPCLHATHHRYLNDVGEVSFGFQIARDVLRQLGDKLDDKVRSLVELKIGELLNRGSFLACLSEKYDVLSQWRAYANNGKGYCIGFRPSERLHGYGDCDIYWSDHLMQCLYGREAVEDRLKERFLRKLEECGGRDAMLASELSRVAWRYAHCAKHEHFKEEEEWRLIVEAPPGDIQYRVGALGLTPFLPTQDFKMEEVWIGPGVGPEPEIAKGTVMQFLSQNSIEAKVEYWKSPYVRR